jgi:magnesium transporter
MGQQSGVLNLGLTLGITAIFVTIISNVLEALLSIIFTKLKFDPAVVSSPLITTIIITTIKILLVL